MSRRPSPPPTPSGSWRKSCRTSTASRRRAETERRGCRKGSGRVIRLSTNVAPIFPSSILMSHILSKNTQVNNLPALKLNYLYAWEVKVLTGVIVKVKRGIILKMINLSRLCQIKLVKIREFFFQNRVTLGRGRKRKIRLESNYAGFKAAHLIPLKK